MKQAIFLVLLAIATAFSASAQDLAVGKVQNNGDFEVYNTGENNNANTYASGVLNAHVPATEVASVSIHYSTDRQPYLFAINTNGNVQMVCDLKLKDDIFYIPVNNSATTICKGGCPPYRIEGKWACQRKAGAECSKISTVTRIGNGE